MRVISGKYKGCKLVSPHGEVRPTTDIVKGSLFSVLTSRGLIAGARCLDVFCGSGGLGIEAISRGASSCVFADIDTRNVTANLDKLKISARTLRGDFRRVLKQLGDHGEKFELVFCDPPYKTEFAHETVELIVKYGLLADNGIAVIEHGKETNFLTAEGTYILDSRSFGAATFELIGVNNEGDFRGDV